MVGRARCRIESFQAPADPGWKFGIDDSAQIATIDRLYRKRSWHHPFTPSARAP
jgi:hypothetical protein